MESRARKRAVCLPTSRALLQSSLCICICFYMWNYAKDRSERILTAQRPRWRTEHVNVTIQEHLQTRSDFSRKAMQSLKKNGRNPVYASWFIFATADSDITLWMGINACKQLSIYNISVCNIIGASNEALKAASMVDSADYPPNVLIHDYIEEFAWISHLQKFADFSPYSSICLLREFLKTDMIAAGVDVWMFDVDVVFPNNPVDAFLDQNIDITLLANIGHFPQTGIGSYSYNFLEKSDHSLLEATLNNGVVSIRSREETRIFWIKAMNLILNHPLADPQHPPNDLFFRTGLKLRLVSDMTWEGSMSRQLGRGVQPSKVLCRALTYPSGYEIHPNMDISKVPVVHLTGIEGLAGNQSMKMTWMRQNNLWSLVSV